MRNVIDAVSYPYVDCKIDFTRANWHVRDRIFVFTRAN